MVNMISYINAKMVPDPVVSIQRPACDLKFFSGVMAIDHAN